MKFDWKNLFKFKYLAIAMGALIALGIIGDIFSSITIKSADQNSLTGPLLILLIISALITLFGGDLKWYIRLSTLIITLFLALSPNLWWKDVEHTKKEYVQHFTSWTTVKKVSCDISELWTLHQGSCELGEYGPGTFRLVPQYLAWSLPAGDKTLQIPPEGVSLDIWAGQSSFQETFKTWAPLKDQAGLGALVAEIGTGVFSNPSEFLVTEPATRLGYTINHIRNPSWIAGAKGKLVVELQKKKE